MDVGFLHPGAMGVTLAANCNAQAHWASDGRSAESRARADGAGIADLASLDAMSERCDVIVSICPPSAARDVAQGVAESGFGGVYVDANAIAPATATAIGSLFERFVDGSVIGPPATTAGTTRLYLSGAEADRVAELWDDSLVDARVLDGQPGSASALKMAYASWTKIGGALMLAIRGLAEAQGVADALVAEWQLSQPGLAERSERVAHSVGPKAWRFEGEMREIAAAYGAADLPTGFADAAAQLYGRLQALKGAESVDLADVLAELG